MQQTMTVDELGAKIYICVLIFIKPHKIELYTTQGL